jgi:hypothetical protein
MGFGPAADGLGEWLTEQQRLALPKSPIGQAIAYARSSWAVLCCYPEHGELSIDNYLAEKKSRADAIGRPNWTFLESDRDCGTAAVLYPFAGTCKHPDIGPFAYLIESQTLTEIVALAFAIQAVFTYPCTLAPLYPDSAPDSPWESCSLDERRPCLPGHTSCPWQSSALPLRRRRRVADITPSRRQSVPRWNPSRGFQRSTSRSATDQVRTQRSPAPAPAQDRRVPRGRALRSPRRPTPRCGPNSGAARPCCRLSSNWRVPATSRNQPRSHLWTAGSPSNVPRACPPLSPPDINVTIDRVRLIHGSSAFPAAPCG